jgi:hypothetical protein
MDAPPRYEHQQVGRLHWLFLGIAALLALAGRAEGSATEALMLVAVVFAGIGICFRSLSVRDAGDRLVLRFGPLPIFSKSIPYASITAVEVSRSTLIDGWGIHWIPGRGWIWNLWGFDCVRIEQGGRAFRIGTDDAEGLAEFLRQHLRA